MFDLLKLEHVAQLDEVKLVLLCELKLIPLSIHVFQYLLEVLFIFACLYLLTFSEFYGDGLDLVAVFLGLFPVIETFGLVNVNLIIERL